MNLLSKLHRNSILTGPIENYCLVCGCLLRSEEESYAHIHEPSHVDKLSSVPQLVDYNDCIIKIKEGYFCRYCNLILPTIKRVGIHVTESRHKDNKVSLCITRYAGVILAFDSVVINDRSWNGLDGSTCSVCNEDYEDEEEHKQSSTHVLNLIQIKCEFGETYVYRKVDEELFFCLICNAILPLLEKQTHHESEKHLELFEKSKAEGTSIRNKKVPTVESVKLPPPAPNELNNNSVKITSKPNSQILDSKKTVDIKPKTQDKKQNGSALDINDNRTGSSKNTRESTIVNTEKAKQAKSDSQINKAQNAPNLTYSNIVVTTNTEDIKLGFLNKNIPTQTIKTEKETANKHISKEAPNKNTQELKDKPKLVNKDAEKKNEAAKVEVDKVSKVINEVNSTSKNQTATEEAEPYLYELLKARNFIIKAHESASYCTICDVNIDQSCADLHCREEHHKILYSKHIARRTELSKLENVINPSEKHGELKADTSEAATDKENVAPVSGQNRKFSEAKIRVAKESRDTFKVTAPIKSSGVPLTNDKKPTVSNSVTTEKTTAVIEPSNKENTSTPTETRTKHQKQTDKENLAPESENQSNEKNKGDIKQEQIETTAPNKKASKKVQKKTAKAKASETETDVHENKTAPAEAREQRPNETPTSASELLSGDSTNVEASDTQNCKQKDQEKVMAKFPPEAEIKTEKLLSLLKTVSHIDSARDVVINGKIVLRNVSFVLVLRTEYEAQCVVCNDKFSVDDINWHVTTDNHRENVEGCLVVTSLEDEFIRQVKSQGYHCGYCNALIPTWADMEHHLSSYDHEDAKTSAAWRLELYLPLIRLVGTTEVRSILNTIFKCTSE